MSATATGRATAKPDTTRIDLTISGIKKEYSEAFDASVSNGNEVKDVLEKIGLKRDSLKTTDFRIDPRYENVKVGNNEYREVFKGYEYVQSLCFEFPIDNSVLGKALYSISRCGCAPRIRFSFQSTELEEARTEALKKAIETARKRAEIMAEASGASILGIRSIGGPEPIRPMMKAMGCRANAEECLDDMAYNVDFEPEDIEISETVTVEWDIA